MEPQRRKEEVEIEIDDLEVMDYLEIKVARSGRSVQDQLLYELNLNRGLVLPDPWDTEGRERAEVLRLILPTSKYCLARPLQG
jgi:hypothetical protein